LWIPITVFAAFMQNLRSALQKHIRGRLSTGGAAYVRFFYALPFALIYLRILPEFGGGPIPPVNAPFLVYCLLGAVAQILFTFLLIHLFSFRNFAVGTTYSKTEVIQIAVLGLILLGDTVSLAGALAIAIGMVGILALSVAHSGITWRGLATGLFEKPTLIGLLCGAFLGASVVCFRGAALALGDGEVVTRAAFTLVLALVMQTLLMGAYLLVREPGQLSAVLRNWPVALMVGVTGCLASIGWFTAFTLENAAYVRAVGQIELVFTFIASVVFFKERSNRLELLGIVLIVGAILILILAE
ncbi:MAG TPA: DMT family transporter, partial [Kiloniellales bacterium]|nr:DMT family transporter [Kiloniellales bacterium]